MSSKFLITVGLIIGTTIGSYLPLLWGDSVFSLSSVFLTFIGGLAGVWLGYKISRNF